MIAARLAHAALMATAALLLAVPAAADTLVDNVNGVTLTDNGDVQRFTGMVIGADGRVKQLLSRGDKRPARIEYKKDGNGRVLLPGLIDGHGHVMGLGFQIMLLDLSDTQTLDEALARIKDYADKNPDMPWIMGRGWNQESWKLGRFPTAAELDRATGGRPAWLTRVDGHAGWANSRAMALAGVTATTKAPPGGRIEMAAGRPSGVFVDYAMDLIDSRKPKPLARDLDRALMLSQQRLLELGITAVADMGTTIEDWQAMRRAGDRGALKVRVISYAAGIDNMALIAGSGPTPWLYDDRLRMVGVKMYLDGALGSRGAWLKAPYSDAPGQRGLPLQTEAQLRNSIVRATMDGFQIAVHAIGDAANAELLGAIAEIAPSYPGDRRWRIEHAQIVDPGDIAYFARNGVVASMQPVHQTSDRLMAEQRLGSARLLGAYAWNSIGKTGARMAFGSDFPVESPNPLPGIAAAFTRQDERDEPVGGWQPQERVDRRAALDGFTRSAAYAGFAEDRIGTLMVGKRADFILLDVDPMTASAADIRRAKVQETWIGGRAVYARHTPTAVGGR